jgi:hypothetical protein
MTNLFSTRDLLVRLLVRYRKKVQGQAVSQP